MKKLIFEIANSPFLLLAITCISAIVILKIVIYVFTLLSYFNDNDNEEVE